MNALSAAAQAARVLSERQGGFVLVPGAGVSYPAIPRSADLEARCRREIARLGLQQPSLTKRPAARYQECMALAYPNAAQRRAFLSGLIVGTEPSAANRRLAGLLGPKGLGRLVLTPNFDDHLSRAVLAQGRQVDVYDHPATAYRVSLESPEIQIVHVHGTYRHYDCCNLPGEIRGRGRARGMRGLVERAFHELTPLVLGYSGWLEDVLMRALRVRLGQGPLAYNLLWFCYRAADGAALPRWLAHHESVRVVVPDTAAGRDTLPAEEVLEHFASQLETRVTPVAAITLDRSAERVAPVVPRHPAWSERRVPLLSALPHTFSGPTPSTATRPASRARWLQTPPSDEGTPYDNYDSLLEDLYLRTWETEPWLALGTCQLRWDLAKTAGGRFGADPLAWRARQAAALHGQALSLRGLGRRDDALAVFGELRAFLSGRSESELRVRAARGLVAEGVTLFESGRRADAHASWEKVAPSAGIVLAAPGLGDELARALFNRGLAWWKIGCFDAALLAWNELAGRFGLVLRASHRVGDHLGPREALAASPTAFWLMNRARLLLARLDAMRVFCDIPFGRRAAICPDLAADPGVAAVLDLLLRGGGAGVRGGGAWLRTGDLPVPATGTPPPTAALLAAYFKAIADGIRAARPVDAGARSAAGPVGPTPNGIALLVKVDDNNKSARDGGEQHLGDGNNQAGCINMNDINLVVPNASPATQRPLTSTDAARALLDRNLLRLIDAHTRAAAAPVSLWNVGARPPAIAATDENPALFAGPRPLRLVACLADGDTVFAPCRDGDHQPFRPALPKPGNRAQRTSGPGGLGYFSGRPPFAGRHPLETAPSAAAA